MARTDLICSVLLVGFVVVQAMPDKSEDLEVNPVEVLVREAEHSVSIAAGPSPSESMQEAQVAEAPETISRRLGKHHSGSDKSVAGGGVIIGGLVTAVFAAVFCYIRVTRRRVGGVH